MEEKLKETRNHFTALGKFRITFHFNATYDANFRPTHNITLNFFPIECGNHATRAKHAIRVTRNWFFCYSHRSSKLTTADRFVVSKLRGPIDESNFS